MKIFVKGFSIILGIVALSACNKLDLNYNPVQPVTVPSSLRLPAIQANLAYSLYAQARFAAYHSYYVTTRTGNSNAQTDTWNYNNITRMGAWRWHYFDVGSNISGPAGMLLRAEEDGDNNYIGVGKIMLALSFLSATDVFGDMPFDEAYSGSFNPLYNTQEEIYAGVERLLDEGIEELQNVSSSASSMNANADLIYQGDYRKWIALANAVRARMKLHTANFTNGYQELVTLINATLTDFEDAVFRYPGTSTSNWEKNLWGESRPNPEWQFADIRNDLLNSLPTDVLMKTLTIDEDAGLYDPRLYKLTTPGTNNKYLGAKMSEGLRDNALPSGTTYQDFANLYNGYWTADSSAYPYMIEEELYFIKAEALYYLNDNQGALTAYKQGVETNLRRLGIEEGQIINFLGSSKLAQTAENLKISDIMMQKWIALYLQAESWVDIRRYHYSVDAYPDLYYPRFALAEWGGRYIQRFVYDPQTEYIYNPKEISRLGADKRDWVFTPLWWVEKSTLAGN
ncbi:SusD/RagB family nutrient-binding outer membrane lipoprotein [Sphingobacterium phlebotomi]|uniref:SusD/RagB family nutrient-binding outer membrane lipoprotein n=1 Tax=Sphingobacterium phlebotomi TaxID=2605433 RepID=A0A5D4H8Q9_9SPHI|nr:SusD/RagB family nutrient-binding outer membrane lipoprotein [Sphingobacterium phlebotomi]TYR37068.1 SusD/RagB family nutrient-binding outer membrane lipoprotein [Sphingobacterium phlebotomi]